MPKRDVPLSHGELLFALFLYGLRIATHHGQAPWLSDRRGPDSLSFSRMKCSLSQNAYPHARIESPQKPITLPGSAVSGLIVRTVNWRNIRREQHNKSCYLRRTTLAIIVQDPIALDPLPKCGGEQSPPPTVLAEYSVEQFPWAKSSGRQCAE